MATFSLVQSATSQADPASATFGSTPTAGNLLIAISMERTGGDATSFTISGSGWTNRIARTVLPTDGTYRRTLAVWTKVAGASEPTNVQVDDGTSNTKSLMIAEYQADVAGTWTYESAASNDNGATTDGTSVSTGTTGSVPSGELLLIGALGFKHSDLFGGTSLSGVTWASSTLTTDASFNGGENGRGLVIASARETTSGTKTSTATTPANNLGLTAGIVVFSFTESGAGTNALNLYRRPNMLLRM